MREIKFRVWVVEQKRMDPGGDMHTFSNPHYLSNCYTNIFLQYTGLKDRNGKEIYEGDIISHKYFKGLSGIQKEIIAPIEFVKGRFGFYEYKRDDDGYFNTEDLDINEVIGNIYENAELLNAK